MLFNTTYFGNKPFNSTFKRVALIFAGSLFIAVSSQVYIPTYLVPITGQTLSLLIISVWLGPINGLLAVLNYIFLGALGAPMFATLSTFMVALASPSFGYIMGFPIATLLMGYAYHRLNCQSFGKFFIAGILSLLPVFLLGILYLSIFIKSSMTLTEAGIIPFIPGEFLKIILAYIIVKKRS